MAASSYSSPLSGGDAPSSVGVADSAAAPPTNAVPTALSYRATTSSTPPSVIVPCAVPATRQPTATVGLCQPRDGGLADRGRLGHAVGLLFRPGEDGGAVYPTQPDGAPTETATMSVLAPNNPSLPRGRRCGCKARLDARHCCRAVAAGPAAIEKQCDAKAGAALRQHHAHPCPLSACVEASLDAAVRTTCCDVAGVPRPLHPAAPASDQNKSVDGVHDAAAVPPTPAHLSASPRLSRRHLLLCYEAQLTRSFRSVGGTSTPPPIPAILAFAADDDEDVAPRMP